MTIADIAMEEGPVEGPPIPEIADRDATLLILIDHALADFSHLSIVDAGAVQDVLLDLRRAISG
jgi:hypothetical protein